MGPARFAVSSTKLNESRGLFGGKPTNTESHHEERNTRKGQLLALTELLRNGPDIRADDTGVEGDDEAGYRHHEGAVPLHSQRPVLGVARVVGLERHHTVSIIWVPIFPRRAGDLAFPRLDSVLLHVGAFGEGTVGEAEVELRVTGRLGRPDRAGGGETVEARRAVARIRAVVCIVDLPRGVALLVWHGMLVVRLECWRVLDRVGGGSAGGVVPVVV